MQHEVETDTVVDLGAALELTKGQGNDPVDNAIQGQLGVGLCED